MMKYSPLLKLILIFGWMCAMLLPLSAESPSAFAQGKGSGETFKLPPPRYDSEVSIEKTLLERRSIRSYKEEPLTLPELSQILWAAQGITEPKRGLRTAPSARALFLIEVYVLPGYVTNLPIGAYRYRPQGHDLIKIADGDKKAQLFKAVGQTSIRNAPAVLIFSGLSERTQRPAWMYTEAGHAAQNVYLQAVSLEMGGLVMGGFKNEDLRKVLNLSEKEQPIYIMPIGKK